MRTTKCRPLVASITARKCSSGERFSIVLLASGVVLWFPAAFSGFGNGVREAAILLHAASALVAIGLFIIHVYMGVFVVPGSVDAIVQGKVTREWARHHHRLWADEISTRSDR